MSTQTTTVTKRHARTRRGCLTCRIRKKKCDSLRPSCTKCTRLHVQCLGYASDRPDWLKAKLTQGDCAKAYTQAIKCFLSEYPAAKAYSDPVPFLVLKTTPEVEQWLSREPGAFNPFYFDPELGGLRQWTFSAPPAPAPLADDTPGVQFPGDSSGEPLHTPRYEAYSGGGSPSHGPLTPSPVATINYLPDPTFTGYSFGLDGHNTPWQYTQEAQHQSLQSIPYVPSQSPYAHTAQHGVATPSYYNQLNEHTVHYVAGPSEFY
ncbi:hypothetical protein BDV93DRAFT_552809 [Ceratobasidium sp. AG-I]|nr:hypothetical protein BDV93DRAFT_552809 [Ceratobasidium sp. AG-I]